MQKRFVKAFVKKKAQTKRLNTTRLTKKHVFSQLLGSRSLDDLGLSSDSELTGDVHHQDSENSDGDFKESLGERKHVNFEKTLWNIVDFFSEDFFEFFSPFRKLVVYLCLFIY